MQLSGSKQLSVFAHRLDTARHQRPPTSNYLIQWSVPRATERVTGPAWLSHYAPPMSHRNVELIIGKLATDEALRRRFGVDAAGLLDELTRGGWELTAVEIEALLALDRAALGRFAGVIDGRLQKIDAGRS